MDRQWSLSAAENEDHVFVKSSRADFSSFRQESAVRPVIIPSMPAARQLDSTLRVGTASAATVMRLEATTSAAIGIMLTTSDRRATQVGLPDLRRFDAELGQTRFG